MNHIPDKTIYMADMSQDPAQVVSAMSEIGAQHDVILSPDDLFVPTRKNSAGYDLSNETTLTMLEGTFQKATTQKWLSKPTSLSSKAKTRPVLNPADHKMIVGKVTEALKVEANEALKIAQKALTA